MPNATTRMPSATPQMQEILQDEQLSLFQVAKETKKIKSELRGLSTKCNLQTLFESDSDQPTEKRHLGTIREI